VQLDIQFCYRKESVLPDIGAVLTEDAIGRCYRTSPVAHVVAKICQFFLKILANFGKNAKKLPKIAKKMPNYANYLPQIRS
jgi:hypothetical protein